MRRCTGSFPGGPIQRRFVSGFATCATTFWNPRPDWCQKSRQYWLRSATLAACLPECRVRGLPVSGFSRRIGAVRKWRAITCRQSIPNGGAGTERLVRVERRAGCPRSEPGRRQFGFRACRLLAMRDRSGSARNAQLTRDTTKSARSVSVSRNTCPGRAESASRAFAAQSSASLRIAFIVSCAAMIARALSRSPSR